MSKGLKDSLNFGYFLEEETAPPLLARLPEMRPAAARVGLFVGPEGGWTDGERRAAADAGWIPVSLGPLVLRAETAATAALAIVMNAWCEEDTHYNGTSDPR